MKRVWRVAAVVVIGFLVAGGSFAAANVLVGPGGRPVRPIELDGPPSDVVTSLPNSEATEPPTTSESPTVVPETGVPATAPPSKPPADRGDDDDNDDDNDDDDTDDDDTDDDDTDDSDEVD